MKKVWLPLILLFILMSITGCDVSGSNSDVSNIDVKWLAAPVISPASGIIYLSYDSGNLITLTTATEGVVIKYSLGDGSQNAPDGNSGLLYNGPFPIYDSVTVKVKAFSLNNPLTESDLSTAVYSVTNTKRVIISQYIEGTDRNKAIELYNGSGSSIDLGDYMIKIYTNSSGSPMFSIALSNHILGDGDCWILVNSQAGATLLGYSDQSLSDLLFNGNDAVELVYHGCDGDVVLDVIGQIDGPYNIKDITLMRKQSVLEGDLDSSDVFDWSVEWVNYPKDTYSGLGSR